MPRKLRRRRQAAPQVVEATVHDEADVTILRLVYVNSRRASGVAVQQFALTPAQKEKLLRDLSSETPVSEQDGM